MVVILPLLPVAADVSALTFHVGCNRSGYPVSFPWK